MEQRRIGSVSPPERMWLLGPDIKLGSHGWIYHCPMSEHSTLTLNMASSSSSSSLEMSMVSTASTGVGLARPLVVTPMAVLLPSLRGAQLPAAPIQPLVQETAPVKIINISDDDEETN